MLSGLLHSRSWWGWCGCCWWLVWCWWLVGLFSLSKSETRGRRGGWAPSWRWFLNLFLAGVKNDFNALNDILFYTRKVCNRTYKYFLGCMIDFWTRLTCFDQMWQDGNHAWPKMWGQICALSRVHNCLPKCISTFPQVQTCKRPDCKRNHHISFIDPRIK